MHLQHAEHALQLPGGIRMDERAQMGVYIILIRRGVGVFLAQIDAACRDAVAEHLRHIAQRHGVALKADNAVRPHAVVDPVFQVVAVAALVVQPGQGDAGGLALGVVGTAIALVVLRAGDELRRGVFAQIVGQPLIDKAQLHTVIADQIAVPGNGVEVLDGMHGVLLPFQNPRASSLSSPSQTTQVGPVRKMSRTAPFSAVTLTESLPPGISTETS